MHISRKLCLLLLLVPFARGQTVSKTFTITSTATTNCPTLDVGSNATVGIDVSGTFSATLQPQVIIGGGNAARNTAVEPYGSTTQQATITAVGGYHTVDLAGATTFIMCASGYASGTATVVLTITPASSKNNSAGGAGTVTSIATTSPITGGTITSTGTIACASCVTASSPGAGIAHFAGSTQAVTSSLIVAADITSGTITGTQLANNTVTATQLAAQYSKGSCTEIWGGSGTSFAMTSGDDAISNNSCYNDSGVTRTITAVKCRGDNASNTTVLTPTFGAAGTGTAILTGTLTCGNSYAYSSTGTVNNASWTTGTGIDPGMSTVGNATSIAMIVEYTY